MVSAKPAPLGSTRPDPLCLARPGPAQEQREASTDQTLQDIFASYAKSLRAALHEVFDKGPQQSSTLSHPSEETRDAWLRKAEEYVKATSAAAVQLGIAPGPVTTKNPTPSWASFLQAAGHLTAPTSPQPAYGQEHVLTQAGLNQVVESCSSLEDMTPTPQLVHFSLGGNNFSSPQQDAAMSSTLASPLSLPDQDASAAGDEALQDAGQMLPAAPQETDNPPVSSSGGHDEALPAALHVTLRGPEDQTNLNLGLHFTPTAASPQEALIDQQQVLRSALFTEPTPPILHAPLETPPQPTRRRTAGAVSLRRSSRLAVKRRTGSMIHRAQEVLARKLGSLPKDQPLTDEALKRYIATFEAPLPQDAIAALSHLFKLDCQLTSHADEALAVLGGHSMQDSQGSKDVGIPTTPIPTSPQTTNEAPGGLVAAA